MGPWPGVSVEEAAAFRIGDAFGTQPSSART